MTAEFNQYTNKLFKFEREPGKLRGPGINPCTPR